MKARYADAMIRLHVQGDLAPGAAVAPTLDQSRYLTQVMRLKAGDELLVFNGRDGEWRVSVAEVLKKGVILRAEEQTRPQAYGPDLELIVAVVKKARIETMANFLRHETTRNMNLAESARLCSKDMMARIYEGKAAGYMAAQRVVTEIREMNEHE